MRLLFLKNMMGVSIISLAVSASVSIASLAFSAVAMSKMKEQDSELSYSSALKMNEDRTVNVQNRLLRLLEAHGEYALGNKNSYFPRALPEVPLGNMTKQDSKDPPPPAVRTKSTTANVEKKLMWLVNGLEEQNPPDENSHFPHPLSESAVSEESNLLTGDDMSVSEPQSDEDEDQMTGAFDGDVTMTHFRTNAGATKPALIEDSDDNPKPPPQDPYDPTNEGTSKEGRHKGQHFHQQGGGVHLIPIIRMGENSQESSGLTVIKPWNS